MAPPPGPYSGTRTLALVARVSAFSLGLIYGNMKLKILRAKSKSHKKAEAKGHH
ncbi:ATPase, F0 complex, subunit E, mitochondrial [Olea europaea subsp. europaea]|uniref:ATPase, F0 complex, subunit E, mitochondrial n=1 Tax=Olea europaea subsp. europaea TaxID=158383 RepID=A0A8S0TZ40_OLEEU|nr:ATPase, F0 complex, subunit E, mitochondrial [Olea europaea subsp. europaea]